MKKPRKPYHRKPYPVRPIQAVVIDGNPCLKVPLTRGNSTIVDSGDSNIVLGHNWCTNSGRYAGRVVGRKWVLLHRLISKCPDHLEVDHINRDGFDNRRANLRWVKHRDNCKNVSKSAGRLSQYVGVSRFPNRKIKPWIAYVGKNGSLLYLGCFDSEVEAALARDEAVRKMSPFYTTNFPDPQALQETRH